MFTRKLLTFAVAAALVSFFAPAAPAGAQETTTTLPNGASLGVAVNVPTTCTEFIIPYGTPTIDVDVLGTASVGTGEPDATFVYVIDTSGSTNYGSGSGCSPILGCEKQFFVNLNNEVVLDGSADLVGVVRYGSSAYIALGLTNPSSSAVNTTINSLGAGGGTNCTDALVRARQLVVSGSNTNGTNSVIFASDGYCNTGGDLTSARNALAGTLARVDSIAVGSGSDCDTDGGTGTLREIAANGGSCYEVPDPGNLPDLIENLIGTSLDSLALGIDGGVAAPITSGISMPLPQPGAISVDYATEAANLGPADHTLCVTAYGSDVTGGTEQVTDCETIHLLQLDYLPEPPPPAENDLNFTTSHTVDVQIAGGTGPARDVDFVVTGQNAGFSGSASVTPPGGASFTYTVSQMCDNLGTDTITASTVIAGETDSIDFTKIWFDAVPPDVSCDPTTNPHGDNEPPAGDTNPDGFYQLNTADPTLDCPVTLMVVDGDGYVFPGPFDPGDKIKYTEANGAPQKQKKMGGPKSAIRWHLIGHGDLTIYSTDSSGNTASAMCLVPPPPS